MDGNMIKQIQRINQNLLQRLSNIRNIKASFDTKLSNDAGDVSASSWLRYAEVTNKQSLDSSISLNRIYRFLRYDNAVSDANTFFKNSKYISDTIPSTYDTGQVISFSVQFANLGVFYSWTSSKHIKLKVSIKREDGSVYDSEYAPLDLNLAQNIPGDETANEDYAKVKIFNISFLLDMPAGVYSFALSIVDDDGIDYNTSAVHQIIITGGGIA